MSESTLVIREYEDDFAAVKCTRYKDNLKVNIDDYSVFECPGEVSYDSTLKWVICLIGAFVECGEDVNELSDLMTLIENNEDESIDPLIDIVVSEYGDFELIKFDEYRRIDQYIVDRAVQFIEDIEDEGLDIINVIRDGQYGVMLVEEDQ